MQANIQTQLRLPNEVNSNSIGVVEIAEDAAPASTIAGPNWTRTKLDFFMTIIWGYLLVHLVVGTKFTYVYPCKSI